MSSLSLKQVSIWCRDNLFKNVNSSRGNGPSNYQKFAAPRGKGQVFLIGAGPGDAELLTLKAYRILQQADVIMYDWLVGEDVVELFPSSAERIFVGKKCGQHSMKQADICQLMLETALQGKSVVRVKGGDPAIFARAAEECEILTQHNVPFCIVPGITAASGASAYAGIPLTHRDCAQSVRFITAHLKSPETEPNWASMVQAATAEQAETLVFYMGLKRLDVIMQRLNHHGMDNSMPVAVIDNATAATQRVSTGQLGYIAEKVALQNFQGPAICIVGKVVSHRNQVDVTMLQSQAHVDSPKLVINA